MRRLSISPTGYRRLCGLALAAQIAIIVSGGAVRLTGSGLGCSDWPTCEEDRLVAPAEYHALIEFLNRAVGTGFVSLTIAAVVVGALLRSPRRPDLLRWSLALVAGVIAQIVLGGLVVLAHLDPRLTGGHFLVSIVMVWAAVVLHHRASLPERADRTHRAGGEAGRRPTRRTLLLSRFAVAAGAVVVVAGAVVTGSGPHGGDTRAERLPYDIGQAARVHSLSAWVLVALSAALAAAAARGGAGPAARRRAGVLLAVLVAQGGVGYLQYFTGVPPALVAVHLLGAALVWTALLRVHLAIAPVRARAGAMTRPSDAAGSGATTRAPAPVLSKG